MILGTGIDITDVERIAVRVERDSGFRELVFSKQEIDYCVDKGFPAEHFAARFAAKEAFLKATGRGLGSGLALNEIEVFHEEGGKPAIRLTGQSKITLSPMGIKTIHVSLSHIKTQATAIVILES
jgi:holo-[acyl-carrier protein] synthase